LKRKRWFPWPKGQILPAAIEHQRRLAEAVSATKAAGVEPGLTLKVLKEFVGLVDEFRRHTAEVERLSAHHEADPMRHAASITRDLKPKMDQLRAAGDMIESLVPGFALATADVQRSSLPEVTVGEAHRR
jgi:glutamine synthetase type III